MVSRTLLESNLQTIIYHSGMFIDLNQIYMATKFRIKKRRADGTYADIGDDENVAPYNVYLYSMFSELEIEMNNELVRAIRPD